MARYSFLGSILPKIEHKLRRHKQRSIWKIATTVDQNLLWSGFQWHRSCHSNEMTLLPILLAAVFLVTANYFILLHFSLLTWWNSRFFSGKLIKREACIYKQIFLASFHTWGSLSPLWRCSMNTHYLLYPSFRKYGEKEASIFNTQKLADRKSNWQKVSVWIVSSSFLFIWAWPK